MAEVEALLAKRKARFADAERMIAELEGAR